MEFATRRSILASALGAVTVARAREKYRVGVIGHTGQGNYGHGIDLVWKSFEQMSVVAVADADPAGRQSAVKRTGAMRGYADYREMRSGRSRSWWALARAGWKSASRW